MRLAEPRQRHPGRGSGAASSTSRSTAADIDAVVLATPASLHAEHVRAALEAGKQVLVEKPLALSARATATASTAAAEATGLALMVGHTFVYSDPVRYLRQLIQNGELGRVLYLYAQRLNLGVIREDLNALWNFAPHDVSILLYLLGRSSVRVHATSSRSSTGDLEDIVFLVLEFPTRSSLTSTSRGSTPARSG